MSDEVKQTADSQQDQNKVNVCVCVSPISTQDRLVCTAHCRSTLLVSQLSPLSPHFTLTVAKLACAKHH